MIRSFWVIPLELIRKLGVRRVRRQISRQTRRFFAGGLTPGKKKQRSMPQNMQASCVRIIYG